MLDDVEAWRTRPLDPVYPIVYFDAMFVKVREEREVLGLWWQETEGSKFWLIVLNDVRRRDVNDVLISCVDSSKASPRRSKRLPGRGGVKTSIVHLIRASLRYVSYRDQRTVASALRPIYTAANAEQALSSSSASTANGARVNRRPSTRGGRRGST